MSILQGRKVIACPLAVADPGFAKVGGEGGRTMASARSASVNVGLAAEPQWGPGVKPQVGVRWVKLKAFCPFSFKKSGQNLRI